MSNLIIELADDIPYNDIIDLDEDIKAVHKYKIKNMTVEVN